MNAEGSGVRLDGVTADRSGPGWALIEAILENLPHMVFVKDAEDLRFVYLNRKAEEVLGRRREELIGRRDADFFPPSQAEFFTTKDRAVLRNGGVIEIAAEPVETAAGTRYLRTKKITLFDSTGTPVYLLGISEDITEQHRRALDAARTREAALSRITAALSAGVISMAFQPIVSLAAREIVGAEAIARFSDRPRRSPDQWFSEAETVGRGVELELLAIESALHQLHAMPGGTFMSVNASPAALADERFTDLLRRVDTRRVVIELSERASVGNYAMLNSTLDRLRAEGVRLAVDDAGAGYASMQHVIELHPEFIKADIGLVRGIDHDPARRAIVHALLGLRAEIGAELVAEGVETERERATLLDLGCQLGQGYLLGRPGQLATVLARSTAIAS